jgi:ADP-ribose pyrophosphatase YjhB (NUDIX family)
MLPEKAFLELKSLSTRLPKFDDGRINYTGSNTAAITIIFVRCRDEILLLKRSDKVINYKSMWDFVSGFYDRLVPAEEIAREELREELGISSGYRIVLRDPFEQVEEAISRKWIIFPVIAEFEVKPKITLNWENADYVWAREDAMGDYLGVPGFLSTFSTVFGKTDIPKQK